MHLTVNAEDIAEAFRKVVAESLPAVAQGQQLAEMMHELKSEIRKANAPWLDRQSAADYCQCSVGTIDNFANAGKLEKHWLGNSPRFRRDDLDALIEGRENRRKAA